MDAAAAAAFLTKLFPPPFMSLKYRKFAHEPLSVSLSMENVLRILQEEENYFFFLVKKARLLCAV